MTGSYDMAGVRLEATGISDCLGERLIDPRSSGLCLTRPAERFHESRRSSVRRIYGLMLYSCNRMMKSTGAISEICGASKGRGKVNLRR